MNAKQLKQLLSTVPDDFEVRIKDINVSGPTLNRVELCDFSFDMGERQLLLPAVEQELEKDK